MGIFSMNFDTVIRHCAVMGVGLQLYEHEKFDGPALNAIRNSSCTDREKVLLSWTREYGIDRGFNTQQRSDVVRAAIDWADCDGLCSDMSHTDALVSAHTDLMRVCAKAFGRPRDFTSFASKFLWLCSPEVVPIYDANARLALEQLSDYQQAQQGYRIFVTNWKSLYEQYSKSLDEIDAQGYPYRVRIFDKILWLVGERSYGQA